MKIEKVIPKDLRDVLAQIEIQNDMGKSSWYEVVYHNGEEWCSYGGSETFSTYGYNVVKWKYVDEIFGKNNILMSTFHLCEFTHTFTFRYGTRHTIVIPAQDITFENTRIQNTKYLQFEGFKNVVLKLKNFTHCPQPFNALERYVTSGHSYLQLSPAYDEITVEIVDKETQRVYETFTHKQMANISQNYE